MSNPELIVMLTYNDMTIENAYEVFESCKNSKALYFGFKEEPLPLNQMKELFSYMKSCGKKTALEVVAYTNEEGLLGAKAAYECGCDLLMGTIYSDEIMDYCKSHNMRYMPFLGIVTERPSVLDGTIEDMIEDAKNLIKKGVFGFDLLGYRYKKDPVKLNKAIVSSCEVPVCIAGSVDSFERLDELKECKPWAFTIGSAFFDHKFGDDIATQIDTVCDYME